MNFKERVLHFLTRIERRLAKQAFTPGAMALTDDFFSDNIPIWEKHLGHLKGRDHVHALEIGSWEGRSALWLLENIITGPSSTLTCLDVFVNRMAQLRLEHNLATTGRSDRVTIIGGKSQKILPLFQAGSCDLIYIDGSHLAKDVRVDATHSWPLLRRDGILIFDDYLWRPDKPPENRPQPAIDQFLQERSQQIELLHKGYQVIVRRIS